MKNLAIIVLAFLLAEYANCQEKTDSFAPDSEVRRWVQVNFAKNKIPPFSFEYGGRNSDSFITKWDYKVELNTPSNSNINEAIYTYTEKNGGLKVKCLVTYYNDFSAVEWVLKFSNYSSKNTPLIEKVKAINHSFTYSRNNSFILHHAKGGNSQRSDFRPFDTEMKVGQSVYMTPGGGRSSGGDLAFPFFNIESSSNNGVVVAIGWTGKWYANIKQKDERSISLESGMEKMKLVLYPKEEIRTPKICLLFWKAEDRMTGHNQFRRFVLAHHTRKINGQHAELPLSVMLAREGPAPCNEHTCATEGYAVAMINRYKQFNIVPEVFWLDAGWYPNQGDWHNVGTWAVNKENFPNGLKPVSDAAHNVGAKFLLWFEPERVAKGTQIEAEHPEWLMDIGNPKNKLFNMGNKDAVNWLTNHISNMIESEGVDIYRQDFNMEPLPYWEKSDPPQRTGISEIRHIEGLYSFWDRLLVKFPNLIIDNCASGGRRIDFETISRSSPLWRTDFHGYEIPNGSQDNTYGLNFYLPLHGTGNWVRSPYNFRSNMSSSMVLNWDINSKDISQAEMQKYIRDYKRLRPYYYGDYYPLTGTQHLLTDETWLAYQLNRPEKDDGIIMAFRRDGSPDDSIQVKLRGLERQTAYELYDEDSSIKMMKTGEELSRGFTLTLTKKPHSLLIFYKKHN